MNSAFQIFRLVRRAGREPGNVGTNISFELFRLDRLPSRFLFLKEAFV